MSREMEKKKGRKEGKEGKKIMKIVGICACTAGVAHTYIAREKLLKAAESHGHEILIETQGTIGTEFGLTEEQIKEADIVIIAVDIKVSEDRFTGKKIMRGNR